MPSNANPNFKDYYKLHPEIHTQFVDVAFDPSVQQYLQLQCNADTSLYTNMPEVAKIEHVFENQNIKNVMEIGGGVGRATVYIANRFDWIEDPSKKYFMVDGNTGNVQHAPIDGTDVDQFYNSFDATARFCTINNIHPDQLIQLDAATEWEQQLDETVKMDIIYSFLSIGFHWSIDLYLDRLKRFCHQDTLLVFGMRGTDRGAEFADKQVKLVEESEFYKVVDNVRESELFRSSVLVVGVK